MQRKVSIPQLTPARRRCVNRRHAMPIAVGLGKLNSADHMDMYMPLSHTRRTARTIRQSHYRLGWPSRCSALSVAVTGYRTREVGICRSRVWVTVIRCCSEWHLLRSIHLAELECCRATTTSRVWTSRDGKGYVCTVSAPWTRSDAGDSRLYEHISTGSASVQRPLTNHHCLSANARCTSAHYFLTTQRIRCATA